MDRYIVEDASFLIALLNRRDSGILLTADKQMLNTMESFKLKCFDFSKQISRKKLREDLI